MLLKKNNLPVRICCSFLYSWIFFENAQSKCLDQRGGINLIPWERHHHPLDMPALDSFWIRVVNPSAKDGLYASISVDISSHSDQGQKKHKQSKTDELHDFILFLRDFFVTWCKQTDTWAIFTHLGQRYFYNDINVTVVF